MELRKASAESDGDRVELLSHGRGLHSFVIRRRREV